MNSQQEHQQPPDSPEVRITSLKIEKLRLETDLIEANMRYDRFRLVLDAVKWSVIGAAVVFAYLAANHLGWL